MSWSIGYGHTAGVYPGQSITQAEADQLLHHDLEQFEGYIQDAVADGYFGTSTKATVRYWDCNLDSFNQGFNIAVDGEVGPGTDQAVQQFQQKQGLVVDGIVGSATLSKLA